jgi:integral membrane protein
MKWLRSEVGRFRLVSLLEGVSYLLLLGVGVPLKYGFDQPLVVKVMGRIHGGLFVFFCLSLIQAAIAASWGWSKVMRALGASLVPFGALWLERTLRREAKAT